MNKLKQAVILLSILLTCSCLLLGKPTDVNYLIPEGFTGGVIILYNQPDGITPETTKDGAIIYRIPQDGFLKIKQPFKRDYHKLNYYFVDAADKQTPIEYLYPKYYVRDRGDTTTKSLDSITEDEQNNQVFVIIHETTSFNSGGGKVYLQSFRVDKPVNASKARRKLMDKMDAIQREMLKAEPIKQTPNE